MSSTNDYEDLIRGLFGARLFGGAAGDPVIGKSKPADMDESLHRQLQDMAELRVRWSEIKERVAT